MTSLDMRDIYTYKLYVKFRNRSNEYEEVLFNESENLELIQGQERILYLLAGWPPKINTRIVKESLGKV